MSHHVWKVSSDRVFFSNNNFKDDHHLLPLRVSVEVIFCGLQVGSAWLFDPIFYFLKKKRGGGAKFYILTQDYEKWVWNHKILQISKKVGLNSTILREAGAIPRSLLTNISGVPGSHYMKLWRIVDSKHNIQYLSLPNVSITLSTVW